MMKIEPCLFCPTKRAKCEFVKSVFFTNLNVNNLKLNNITTGFDLPNPNSKAKLGF